MLSGVLFRLTRVLCRLTGMARMARMICDTCEPCEPEILNSNKKANLKPPELTVG